MVQSIVADKSDSIIEINAVGLQTRDLNIRLREASVSGAKNIKLINICGQRYIGTDLNKQIRIEINGTPGNDLGAFMNGPQIIVHGNAQDGCGNTMDEGEIVVHGHAGDIVGLSARGGKIFVRDNVGYRAGIHMKEYAEKKPVIVIGGTAQDFLGEYMAGGVLILLGLNLRTGEKYQANYIGTGMHSGVIYVRGTVNDYQLGKEVGIAELDEEDRKILFKYISEFSVHFSYDSEKILCHDFVKLFPLYLRPYGCLYAY